MAFVDIPGNARIKNILKRALAKGRLPHALVFSGPEGVGKRRTARTLAQALNCLELTDDACGRCAHCRAIEKGALPAEKGLGKADFPDVMEIDAEKGPIKIETMRFLKKAAYLRPMSGKHRVFIIDDADKMSPEGAHSILKVLEEPPAGTYIILVTANPHLLLSTIMSRCQVLEFAGIGEEEIAAVLEKEGHPAEQARILSLLAQGSLSRALDMDWEEVVEERRRAWELLESLLMWNKPSRFLMFFPRSLAWRTEDTLRRHMEMFASFCRDCLLIASEGDPRLLMNPDYDDPIAGAAAAAGPRRSLDLLDRVESVLQDMPKKLNINLLVNTLFAGLET